MAALHSGSSLAFVASSACGVLGAGPLEAPSGITIACAWWVLAANDVDAHKSSNHKVRGPPPRVTIIIVIIGTQGKSRHGEQDA